jgi:hypothetical protein
VEACKEVTEGMSEEQWQKMIESRIIKLELDHAVDSERHRQVIDRLAALEDNVKEQRADGKWTFRLLVGTILGMVMTIITVFLKAGIPVG